MPLELRQVMLQSALTDGERMRKLIQDFLTLSELESGRIKWHLEPLPLKECVDLALSSIRARQLQTELPRITAQVPSELPLVQTDGEWVVEVLSKLLDNACKFTEPNGQVMIEAHTNGRQMLEVTVADTGRGIEPNRLETVFDRFYQEEGALRRTTGGTGLGLAICRQIVTGLGGRIWAESNGKDQGSQFHFTIPISQTEANKQSFSPQKKRRDGQQKVRFSPIANNCYSSQRSSLMGTGGMLGFRKTIREKSNGRNAFWTIPIFGGGTGGLLTKAFVEEKYAITWTVSKSKFLNCQLAAQPSCGKVKTCFISLVKNTALP